MSKRDSVKHKIDRRLGENLWGRPKSPLNNRAYGPGQHGQRRKGKTSDYGLQLRAKQKLKGYYGSVTEKAFKKLYTEAARVKGDTGENLIGLLESRLDAIVYRAKFVPTIPSYQVKVGDKVEIKERSKQLGIVLEANQLGERDVPEYVEVDHSKQTAVYVRVPALADVPYPVQMEPNLVVEFYSR
jgi:small subunit ribosomal protein S4